MLSVRSCSVSAWSVTRIELDSEFAAGGVAVSHTMTELDGSSVVHPIVARLKRSSVTAVPEMTGGVSSTMAVSEVGPDPPEPSLASKYVAVMVSPFCTCSSPSPGVGTGLFCSWIEPAKTDVALPVSVRVTTSGSVSVLLVTFTCAVSGLPGSRFRSVSITVMSAIAFDW